MFAQEFEDFRVMNGEVETFRGVFTGAEGVYSNDPVAEEQGPARIAGIDRHVGLDVKHILAAATREINPRALPYGADNTTGNAELKSSRVADGLHRFAEIDRFVGIEPHRPAAALDLDQRQIESHILGDDLAEGLLLVVHLHFDERLILDHVPVGQHHVGRDEESGAQ